MTTNSFESQEINIQLQPLPTYIDSDGSFKINTPMLSSYNFDGLIPKKDEPIDVTDVKPGYLIQIEDGGQYFPVVSISADEPLFDDTNIITINYINDLGNLDSQDYDETDTVNAIYEDWDEKIIGSQGWGITSGGNAIFTNVAVRGDLEASTLDVGGVNGITYDGSTVIIGADVVVNAPIEFNGVTQAQLDSELAGYVTSGQLTDNTTTISGGNIKTGTISAITFQTNLSGRRSKLGAGNAYIPSNWSTTIVPRSGGGSTSYIPTGLEFYDQNGARTGYFYSLDKYTSGTFQPGSRLFVFGSTDSSGLDTGTEILLSHSSIDLYATGQIDINSGTGVRLYGSNNSSINVGSFGSNQIYIDGQIINFSQTWSGATSSARFYSHVYAMSGYKFYGNLEGNATNISQYLINQNLGTGSNVQFNSVIGPQSIEMRQIAVQGAAPTVPAGNYRGGTLWIVV